MKLLVLTAAPISAEELRQALPAGEDPAHGEVMVVAPAIQQSPLRFWLSDADTAIERAREAQEETVQALEADGASARGDTGEGDSASAIEDALQTFQADRVLVFVRAGADAGYREDVDPAELQERFGLPVDRVELG